MAPPLGILLLSGEHDRAHYALVLATGAAALGREVTLFATNRGCRLFLADQPLLADPREAALAERGVAGIATLLGAAARNSRQPALVANSVTSRPSAAAPVAITRA